MVEFVEEDDFAEGSLSIGGMLEGIENFLERQDLSCFAVVDFPDMAVGAAAHFLEEGVFFEDVRFDLLAHVLCGISECKLYEV